MIEVLQTGSSFGFWRKVNWNSTRSLEEKSRQHQWAKILAFYSPRQKSGINPAWIIYTRRTPWQYANRRRLLDPELACDTWSRPCAPSWCSLKSSITLRMKGNPTSSVWAETWVSPTYAMQWQAAQVPPRNPLLQTIMKKSINTKYSTKERLRNCSHPNAISCSSSHVPRCQSRTWSVHLEVQALSPFK